MKSIKLCMIKSQALSRPPPVSRPRNIPRDQQSPTRVHTLHPTAQFPNSHVNKVLRSFRIHNSTNSRVFGEVGK